MIETAELERYLEDAADLRSALGIAPDAPLPLTPIGQGEYNANYRFTHPGTGRELVLRVNVGSQMHLPDQIGYEYRALRLLEPSGRTPRAHYVDGSLARLPYGVLVMDFLPGRPLVYETDLPLAARVLADIHAVPVPEDSRLVRPADPLRAIVAECCEMFAVYTASRYAEAGTVAAIERLARRAGELVDGDAGDAGGGGHSGHGGRHGGAADGGPQGDTPGQRHVISTELNSGNFLINSPTGRDYLVDWEKPVLGEVEQDLAHFLAPTTTLWKTDTILTRDQMRLFLAEYRAAVADRFPTGGIEERFEPYLSITCLRGITWCAMAYVEYQDPGRALKNELTYEKIRLYISAGFLEMIEARYFG